MILELKIEEKKKGNSSQIFVNFALVYLLLFFSSFDIIRGKRDTRGKKRGKEKSRPQLDHGIKGDIVACSVAVTATASFFKIFRDPWIDMDPTELRNNITTGLPCGFALVDRICMGRALRRGMASKTDEYVARSLNFSFYIAKNCGYVYPREKRVRKE